MNTPLNTLLIVDDEPRLADFLQRGLRAEGFSTVVAGNGGEALEAAAGGGFAAIVLDIMLGDGIDGLEVCRRLRARGDGTPILMLTALDSVDDRVSGLHTGGDDYLAKPFAFEELLARLAALIRRAGGTRAVGAALNEPRRLGDLVLDPDSLVVTRHGQRVDLAPKELALLELLMASPGRVHSRERILNRVWGIQADPLTNVVEVHVARLRRKLQLEAGAAVAAPVITTVRGRGYRIELAAPGLPALSDRDSGWVR